jgi:deoxyribose-phosphate aldolase
MSIDPAETLRVLETPGENKRNAGMPLDLGWVKQVQVNRSSIERSASALASRRALKKEWRAAWLLRAIRCIDLTYLSGGHTAEKIGRLCATAKYPVRNDLLTALDVSCLGISTAAVCVYPAMVAKAFGALKGSGIPVAAALPIGLGPLKLHLEAIACAVEAGAREIEIVITREYLLTAGWEQLYEEIASSRQASHGALLKIIFPACELATLANIQKASLVAMMAGADFIRTSSASEANPNLDIGLAVVRAIREYRRRTGNRIGLKAAGVSLRAKEALDWLVLLKEELGPEWLEPELFRIGASLLVNDIERQLEYYAKTEFHEQCA